MNIIFENNKVLINAHEYTINSIEEINANQFHLVSDNQRFFCDLSTTINNISFNSIDEVANLLNVNKIKSDDKKFIYNDSFNIDTKTDFSEWINFNLTGYADINSYGDKSKITWKTPSNEIAIEEFPIYTRTKTGSGLLANFTLKRDLSIRFYRKDGTYETLEVPQKTYSFKERTDAEKKSRANIIDNTRDLTGKYIYQKNIVAGTPQLIEAQLTATLTMFKSLSVELSVYREDREVGPLVSALSAFVPTELIPQDVLSFIISKVNIIYY